MSTTISEGTKIKVSLVITSIGLIVGAAWWASAVNSKLGMAVTALESLRNLQAAASARTAEIDKEMAIRREQADARFLAMERRLALLESRASRESRATTVIP